MGGSWGWGHVGRIRGAQMISKILNWTSSPWKLSVVPNCCALQTAIVQAQCSKTEDNNQRRRQTLEKKEVNIQVINKLAFCFKKSVESQHSSSSPPHVYNNYSSRVNNSIVQVVSYNSKKFHGLNKTLDLEMTGRALENYFKKISLNNS